jgi:hypothetical protein
LICGNLAIAMVIDGLRWYFLGKKAVGVGATANRRA